MFDDAPQITPVAMTKAEQAEYAAGRNITHDAELLGLLNKEVNADLRKKEAAARFRQKRIYEANLERDKTINPNAKMRSLLTIDPYLHAMWEKKEGRGIFLDPKERERFIRDTPELQRPNLPKKVIFGGIGEGRCDCPLKQAQRREQAEARRNNTQTGTEGGGR